MMPETPLNQGPIRCAACAQVVTDWYDWFTGDCPASPKGHDLTWPLRMLLKFKMEVKV